MTNPDIDTAEPSGDAIVNSDGHGYGVFRSKEIHKRTHLWRVDGDNRYHSIATFTDDAQAEAFMRWLLQLGGLRYRTTKEEASVRS